jgi:hypothetical protein
MRLEPLYRVGFTYPESWAVGLDGGWQQMFFVNIHALCFVYPFEVQWAVPASWRGAASDHRGSGFRRREGARRFILATVGTVAEGGNGSASGCIG